MRRFELCGHRGARGLWPENTLAGFEGALRLGVDAIELDVVLSSDGVPMVTHDLTLNPDLVRGSTGTWIDERGAAVRSLTAAELQDFDVGRARPGSAVAAAHPRQVAADGARMPRLDEVFRLLADAPVVLDVELKTGVGEGDPLLLAQAVIAVAQSWGVFDRLAVRSFAWRGLLLVRQRRPEILLGYLTETADLTGLHRLAELARPGDVWAPAYEGLEAEAIRRAHRLGLRVKPWTVNDPADMRRLVAMGVDGFCTDDPDIGREVLAGA